MFLGWGANKNKTILIILANPGTNQFDEVSFYILKIYLHF
jgi:hypothetical protein